MLRKTNEEGIPYLESINKNGTSIIFDDNQYIVVRNNIKNILRTLQR